MNKTTRGNHLRNNYFVDVNSYRPKPKHQRFLIWQKKSFFFEENSSKSLCSCESCSALYIAEFARKKITEERHSRLKSQEHGKTVPMKHKLKGRIQVRKGRTKEDEEDGKEMLGVCTSVCVSCCLLSSLNSSFVEGMDALLMGRVGGCLGVYM